MSSCVARSDVRYAATRLNTRVAHSRRSSALHKNIGAILSCSMCFSEPALQGSYLGSPRGESGAMDGPMKRDNFEGDRLTGFPTPTSMTSGNKDIQ